MQTVSHCVEVCKLKISKSQKSLFSASHTLSLSHSTSLFKSFSLNRPLSLHPGLILIFPTKLCLCGVGK